MKVYLTPHPTAVIVTVVAGELFQFPNPSDADSCRVLLAEDQAQAFMKHIQTYPTLYQKASFATHDIYIRDLTVPPLTRRLPCTRSSPEATSPST